ncbi:MAG: hypothetical protein Q7W02_12785 [Candidatus Rokubacteria bacterium]|nr:hypothetical protein [Candidatus Rokubacteria bacterium]
MRPRIWRKSRIWAGTIAALLLAAAPISTAGPIFLTGHDPDFHAPGSAGAANLLRSGLSFVTGGTFDDGVATKFLWVESRIATPGGHLIGENGLVALGLALGTNYDRVNAAEFATASLSGYTAIAIASSFGGLLTRAELDALIARSTDIKNFINAGRGLLALSECFPCGANLLTGSTPPDLFGFLPVDVSSIAPSPPFTVTPEGAAAPFGLVNTDVNDPTHNSFGLIGGLTPLDRDTGSQATTLAGDVRIDDGGFCGTPTTPPCSTGVPSPGGFALIATGLLALAGIGRARKRSQK